VARIGEEEVGELARGERALLLPPDGDELACERMSEGTTSVDWRCERHSTEGGGGRERREEEDGRVRAGREQRTVHEAQHARRLLLLVGPGTTLALDDLGPLGERLARLERLVVVDGLVRVGVAGPAHLLLLRRAAEEDEVLALGRERDAKEAGDELEAVRVVDVGEVKVDVLGRLEAGEARRPEVLEDGEELLRVADLAEDL